MESERPAGLRGAASTVPLRLLRLDPDNPRIPESIRSRGQDELADALEMGFEAYAVAQSIADNGFFVAEPLLVISDSREPGAFVVVEGNRRLTALLGLANADIRDRFEEAERWNELAGRSGVDLDFGVPVVIHASREATHSEVARAHVVGKLSWAPYMQARFIAARVAEGLSMPEVADLIGIDRSKAANLYRDQAIVKQAQALGFETQEVERAFSLVTVAMGNTKIRDHIQAPLGSRLVPGDNPIPTERESELGELLGWIFGDEDNEPKINDSRQIAQLGNVVASPVGLASLRAGDGLETAKQKVHDAGMDPRQRLVQRLTVARNALNAAGGDLGEYFDDDSVVELLQDVASELESLLTSIEVNQD
jgi:hypothetical protein